MKHAHARHHAARENLPSVATTPEGAAAEPPPKDEFVREAAYFYYEQRGRVGGHELDDWLRAEAEFERLSAEAPGETSGH
jgi:hypothetical protein